MILSLSLLALAICATWLPPANCGSQGRIPLWLPLALLAAVSALAYGLLTPLGLCGLVLLALSAFLGTHQQRTGWHKWFFDALTILFALALAMHRWPGFNNPLLVAAKTLSADSLPLTLYANVDKGAAGLLLLALCCRRSTSMAQLRGSLRQTWWLILLTITAVMASGIMLHVVRPDLKLPSITWQFLAVNLFFTVVAEEAFFRGFIQEHLAARLGQSVPGAALSVFASALLFGLAHLPGGLVYAGLATMAGLGYALVYQRSRRIESAIAAHFLLNTVHFFAFSYPALKQA